MKNMIPRHSIFNFLKTKVKYYKSSQRKDTLHQKNKDKDDFKFSSEIM